MTVRRHFVHVYTTIRIKVAVDAEDHRTAMQAADAILFGDRHAVRLNPIHSAVVDADYAEEVTEYLVDEAIRTSRTRATMVPISRPPESSTTGGWHERDSR